MKELLLDIKLTNDRIMYLNYSVYPYLRGWLVIVIYVLTTLVACHALNIREATDQDTLEPDCVPIHSKLLLA